MAEVGPPTRKINLQISNNLHYTHEELMHRCLNDRTLKLLLQAYIACEPACKAVSVYIVLLQYTLGGEVLVCDCLSIGKAFMRMV